mmetsp:Transcript_58913/g.170403  ORF Transcript_58913/g.170403 Transcript_58913/m.170403 type:complete len:210 (+) Transcript_58913:827-1456(+)
MRSRPPKRRRAQRRGPSIRNSETGTIGPRTASNPHSPPTPRDTRTTPLSARSRSQPRAPACWHPSELEGTNRKRLRYGPPTRSAIPCRCASGRGMPSRRGTSPATSVAWTASPGLRSVAEPCRTRRARTCEPEPRAPSGSAATSSARKPPRERASPRGCGRPRAGRRRRSPATAAGGQPQAAAQPPVCTTPRRLALHGRRNGRRYRSTY